MTTTQAIDELNKFVKDLMEKENCALEKCAMADDSPEGQEWLHEIELGLEALAMSKRALIEIEGNA